MRRAQPIEIGERVPDVLLATSAGDQARLSALRGEATLLIFLRHLG